MSTISEELQRIVNAKASIKSAIESKGVTVATDLLLSSYADKILEISSGGGGSQTELNAIIDSLRSRGLDLPSNISWSDVPYYIELLVKATDAEQADSDFLISDQLAENEVWYKTVNNQPVSSFATWNIKDINNNNCNPTYNYYDPNSGYCKVEFDRNVYSVGAMFSTVDNAAITVVFSNYLREIGAFYIRQSQFSKIIVGRGLTKIDSSFSSQPIGSISLPSSLTNITGYAFNNSSISKIKCYATTAPTLSGQPFFNVPATGIIYIPKGADYSSWMSATGLSGWTFIDNL